jgi:hypothetical protein
MLRRVALVKTDVSEELSATFIRVKRIGELGTRLTVTSNLMKEALSSSETSVLTRATRHNIPVTAVKLQMFQKSRLSSLSYGGATTASLSPVVFVA